MASPSSAASAAVANTVMVLLLCLSGICAVAATPAAALAGPDYALSKVDLCGQSHGLALKEVGALTFGSTGARKLLGSDQFVTLQPKCMWEQSGGGWCAPLKANWLQYSGMPSSPFRRATLMADQRDNYCSQAHKDRASCIADQANRCYWWRSQDGSKTQCASADFNEMRYYERRNFTASPYTIPAAMTCPGTKAAEFYACFARPDGDTAADCNQVPNCFSTIVDGSSKVCLPSWMKSYSQDQFGELWRGLEDLKPDLYGNCAGVCWIREAKLCLTKAAESGCKAVPFCFWDSSTKTCSHNTIEFDANNDYDFKVRRLYGMCLGANQNDCETYSKGATSKAESDAAEVWRKYKPSANAVQCKLT